MILVAALLLVGGDRLQHSIGGVGLGAGIGDETAHLATGFLVFAALLRGGPAPLLLGMLLGSVAIDLDHVPLYFQSHFLTAGTERPYTHSFLTCTVLFGLAVMAGRSWRQILLGLCLGVLVHFGRDLGESGAGVPLAWPWSYRSYHGAHDAYAAVMTLMTPVALVRGWMTSEMSLATHSRTPP